MEDHADLNEINEIFQYANGADDCHSLSTIGDDVRCCFISWLIFVFLVIRL